MLAINRINNVIATQISWDTVRTSILNAVHGYPDLGHIMAITRARNYHLEPLGHIVQ